MQRPAEHAAVGVDLLDVDLQRLQLRIAEKGRRPGDRQHRADLDRIGRQRARACAGQRESGERRPEEIFMRFPPLDYSLAAGRRRRRF